MTRARETGETPGPIARPVNQGGTRPAMVWPFPRPGQSDHYNFTGQENRTNIEGVAQLSLCGTRLQFLGVDQWFDGVPAQMRGEWWLYGGHIDRTARGGCGQGYRSTGFSRADAGEGGR